MRKKLVFGILMMIVVMTSIGLLGIYLIDRQSEKNVMVLANDYDVIQRLQRLGQNVALLNARYLQSSFAEDGARVDDKEFYLEKNARIQAILEFLESTSREETLGIEGITSLRVVTTDYLSAYDDFMSEDAGDLSVFVSRVSRDTERIALISEKIIAMNEVRMMTENSRASHFSDTARALIIGGLVIGTIVASILYWKMGELIMRPVSSLTRSVREIKKNNFELSIPVNSNDEMGELSGAFNEMAADMRELLIDSDQRLVEANVDNRAVMEAFPFPLILLNPDGQIRQINPAAEILFEKLKTPARLPAKVADIFEKVRAGEGDYVPAELSEAILFRVDDEEFFYLPRIFRIKTETGVVRGWAILLADVSRLRWMDGMRTDLLSTVSHEIKTPLTSIRMVLHLLDEQKNGDLNEKQARMVASARDNCERLLQVLDDLLQISRLESGFSNLQVSPTAPSEIVSATVATWRERLEADSITLEVNEGTNLPRVMLDRARILKVLDNYFSNAQKYALSRGKITLTSSMKDPETVRFAVSDNGEGVPKNAGDHIFEKFYRAPNQESEGTGLGLAICREIIHAHGGRLGFKNHLLEDDTPARTEFYFDLPLAN